MLFLLYGDRSRTQEGECEPLEAGTRELVKDGRLRRQKACFSEL
jgi:hypothetical protein